jgi:tRNA dimethylallyltransferase
MRLAERFGGLIIGADSRQIYRGFDIGTAKPTADDRRRVPHRGIDLVDPVERYSAAAWAEGARAWIREASGQGRIPVVVGGSGFYIRGLVDPLFREPPLDPGRRAALQAELDALRTDELRRWCERLDPSRAHLGRTQLLRATEIALLTGVPISVWHQRSGGVPALDVRYLLLDPGRRLLERIVERIHVMLAAGWIDEVRDLAEHVPPGAPAWNATGYRAVLDLGRGHLSTEAAIERITIDTRQYAKRQRTWFRHQLPVRSVTVLEPTSARAERAAAEWWEARDTA